MASLALGAIGSAIGGPIGGAIGSLIGSAVDSFISSSGGGGGTQRIEGQRLDLGRITGSAEGAVIPKAFGRVRLGGNVIWATDFREEIREDRQRTGGGKGGGGGGGEVVTTTYRYYASFAVALCEGPITGIGRIWADGQPMDLEGVTWRWYRGDEIQDPDPFITAKSGPETPAYRGTAYIAFEELFLEPFGNRIPQLTFEVFRALADPETAEGEVTAVTMIPGAGEFVYATEKVTRHAGAGQTAPENVHAVPITSDFTRSLDYLQASLPNIESVSLIVSWFGSDLRAGECEIRPRVEIAAKDNSRAWSVAGLSRNAAQVVSRVDDLPAYGGTPADWSVVQAIQECRKRGLRVTFYPFIMMDVPQDNSLPDPYSDEAAEIGQPAYPWRGRITCSPAAGFDGSVDKSSAAAAQVAQFFTRAWGYRRMVLHYASLCASAGGIDAFVIGSEMRGLTSVRSDASTYPAVAHLIDLAGDCRQALGGATAISYAADWSEYFGHHPQDGSEDVYFNLDPLWASPNIDFIGIDNYMPLSDWRDGFEHEDAVTFEAIWERAYLQSNIEGGEGFDWFYASDADRAVQARTPITDGSAGKPWVFRYKDLRSWWGNRHYNRLGGVEAGSPTSWIPESKPIRFTEFGCPTIDGGTNQPNVFVDPKSSESLAPYFSRGWRDDHIQRAYIEAVLLYWRDPANNPESGRYSGRMIDVDECAVWTWDARPYPWFPALEDVWSDGANWRLGHWLNGRLGSASLPALVRALCIRGGLDPALIDVSQLWGDVDGYVVGALESARSSIETLATYAGFDAVESEGRIVFRMRGREPVARISLDDLSQAMDGNGDLLELERGQETELPQALKWTVMRADEEYDAATVESRRVTVSASRVNTANFPIAVPPEEAERAVRRALQELWVSRERASFRLPPSLLALDPGDVIALEHDGRVYDLRLLSIADETDRSITAVRQDREIYNLPPGTARAASISRLGLFGAPVVAFVDVPQLLSEEQEHQPLIGAYAQPWPGSMAVYRSPEESGFSLLTTLPGRATLGMLVEDLYSAPPDRFDLGNSVSVELLSGMLESVSDPQLFEGANALAIESAPGLWEIAQFSEAELIAPGRYRLGRLLRGQRGTEGAIGNPTPSGSTVVVLDTALARLPIAAGDIDREFFWRVGPAQMPHTDESYVAAAFTPSGVGLRPFSVDHVRQPWRWARDPGDLEISWIRRTRDLGSDSWRAPDVPLGEEFEAYEVDILHGSAVLRTLESDEPRAVYSGDDQLADWEALLTFPASLDIVIYQISASYGRGAPAPVTLFF